MTDTSTTSPSNGNVHPPARASWPSLLALLPSATIAESLARVQELGYSFGPIQPSGDGFALLQLEDSTQRQPFNLGELPLATAVVRVTTPDGRTLDGAAQLMTSDVAQVEGIAVWDAILADDAQEDEAKAAWRIGAALLEQAQVARDELTQQRQAILGATKVKFQMMDE